MTHDSILEIEGVSSGRIHFTLIDDEIEDNSQIQPKLLNPVASSRLQSPQIQVMHSLPHPSDSYAKPQTAIRMALGISTPIEEGNEERKVYETPAVKSRHIDPNSSPRLRPQRSPSNAIAHNHIGSLKRISMMGGEVLSDSDHSDALSDSEEEPVMSSHFAPMAPMTTGEDNGAPSQSEEQQPSRNPPVSDGGSNSPAGLDRLSENVHSTTSSPNPNSNPLGNQHSPVSVGDSQIEDGGEGAKNIPDSLPDVFRYELEKKLKTPLRLYGRRANGATNKQHTVQERSEDLRLETEETGIIPAGSQAVEKTLEGRKRKAHDEMESESPITDRRSTRNKKRKGLNLGEDELMASAIEKKKGIKEDCPPISGNGGDSIHTALQISEVEVKRRRSGRISTGVTITQSEKAKGKKANPAVENDSNPYRSQFSFPSTTEADAEEPNSASTKSKTANTLKDSRKPVGTSAAATKKRRATTGGALITLTKPKFDYLEPTGSPSPVFDTVDLIDFNITLRNRTRERYDGPAPRIAFSNSTLTDARTIRRLPRNKVPKVVTSPADPSCNFLVVGPGEIKRTPKFIIAAARGIFIVEEQWIEDSTRSCYWLDPVPYIPKEPSHEIEWGSPLSSILSKYRDAGCKVFHGKTIYLTLSLADHLKALDMHEGLKGMLKAAGAENILRKIPRKRVEDDVIVLGKEDGEKDFSALDSAGWKVFTTAVVGMSVLRGSFQDGDEFLIKSAGTVESEKGIEMVEKKVKGKKGSGRKSTVESV
jgi:hypothetical protein